MILINKNADVEDQAEALQREINKQKQMHRMLSKYKKEEDENFKDKF